MIKKYFCLALTVLMMFSVLCGCKNADSIEDEGVVRYLDFVAMSTYVNIRANADDDSIEAVRDSITAASSELDCMNPSALTNLNSKGTAKCSDLLVSAIRAATEYYKLTDGSFNPCLLELKKCWNIGEDMKIPSAGDIEKALASSDCSKITISDNTVTTNGAKIDLGGIAKGLAADNAIDILKKNHAKSAIISVGGTVGLIGSENSDEPYTVAVRHPRKDGEALGKLQLTDCFISTSGDYQQYKIIDGKRYHHIFGKDGSPAQSGLISATVIGQSGAATDALSTAFFVMGEREALKYIAAHEGIEALFVTEDNRVIVTKGLAEKFELSDDSYTLTVGK